MKISGERAGVIGGMRRDLLRRAGAAATAALALAGSACGRTGASPTLPITGPEATVLYYQPYADKLDAESLRIPPHVYRMVAERGQSNSWTSTGSCNPENAANWRDTHPNINKVVAFSLGRIGVQYAGKQAGPEVFRGVRQITVVAPGNYDDFFVDSCDSAADVSQTIGKWLQFDSNNQLMVVADRRTAESNFAGIRDLYLDALANIPVSRQVTLCAANLSHTATWLAVKDAVLQPLNFSGSVPLPCPAQTTPIAWNR